MLKFKTYLIKILKLSLAGMLFLSSQLNSSGFRNAPYSTRKAILEHYKNYALYNKADRFNPGRVRVIVINPGFVGNLFVVIDYNPVEFKTMLYAYIGKKLYPIHDLKTYNEFVNIRGLKIYRRNVYAYFRVFLYLQQYYSRNMVYSSVDKKKLSEIYGRYGGNGFKERLQNYFLDELEIKRLSNGSYYVSFPTFTVLGRRMYYRLRVTHAVIKRSGQIEKIWGTKSVYFIYNGEKAKLKRKQRKYFEKNVY